VLTEIRDLAQRLGVPVERVASAQLRALGGNTQGVALRTSPYPYLGIDALLAAAESRAEPPFLLVLDLINDPQNLGSLLRTCDAVGVHGVVIQERRAAAVTPAVVRASSGAVEHLRVARVTNVARTLGWLKENGVWAAGLDADPSASRYDRTNLGGSLALVVGSEGRGLRRLVREKCDFLVRLPMVGHVESLNASVAGSIVLYEAWRQRQGAADE
jgi:23S rRNA (guanosine2251-2'-O)-methyltransferase